MELLAKYDKTTILADEVFQELFEEPDEIMRARMVLSLQERAKELGVKNQFEEILKAYKRTIREYAREQRAQRRNEITLENWTNFTSDKYDRMYCGPWIASDNGVYAQSFESANDIVACYHPILPIKRLKNVETGEEQIVLAYKRNNRWQEIKVAKDIISSASKIVALSKLGISVTSENAKYLVKYLSDVENFNDDDISIALSTSKLGWNGTDFIPYDTTITFDGDNRFRNLFEAVREQGSFADWMEHVKSVRATNRIESKFMLAASFSSALVKVLGVLPYIVDLWGETEGGKTVCLMLAASIWADPDESQYIGDFKTTDVALEAKADMLNSLPMLLDDTSKTSARVRDNFEGIVYDLCSGKGKSRSNKELGVNRENRWKNCIITNGERPLQSYVNQGGALNRILEIECGRDVFENPQLTAGVLKKNFGFAGKQFVQIIKEIGFDEVKRIYSEICKNLFSTDKMQKQSMSLAVVLTADRIATDYLFKDGCYISLDEAKETLVDRNMVSDNERCYQYLVDKVSMNAHRFDLDTNCEKWGVLDEECAILFPQALDEICSAGGFSKKSFLSWAEKKEILVTSGGRQTKLKKINGSPKRCYFIRLNAENDGFIGLDELDEEQIKLPFD